MTIALLAIAVGFGVLVWSADRFITGSEATAGHFGISPLIIGLVIVGFGTSAPEMLVSAQAALDGKPDLALGNALGSNIVNTALVLGITALVSPILVHSNIVRKEIPMLIAIGVLFGVFIWDGSMTRTEASLLLLGSISLIAWAVYTAKREINDHLGVEIRQELDGIESTLKTSLFWLFTGLLLMIISSRILVWGAVGVAELLGVSNHVIGLTIVALGTSLPELAASIVAVRKGQHDIAIGNVIGSNMFNLLAVAGIAGFISPMGHISPDVLARDWPVVMALTIALLLMAFGFGREGKISRTEGLLLVLSFVAYNWYLFSTLNLTH
ncbi:MAG: cation:H+ antiporter [Pseudoalteromonas tetraodonis]|jgi:cation:H+ antiporter